MAEDYAQLKRRLEEMQAQKGTIQGTLARDVAPGYSEVKAIKPPRILERIGYFMVVVVVLAWPCHYGIHLYRNYVQIQNEFHKNSSRIIQPVVDDESVSEIGYIYSIRRDTYLREPLGPKLNLVWFIAIPSENTRWSCSYEAGFPDFKVGDGIELIHKKNGVDASDYTGYMVGLHDTEQGKATRVWVLDMDELDTLFGSSDE